MMAPVPLWMEGGKYAGLFCLINHLFPFFVPDTGSQNWKRLWITENWSECNSVFHDRLDLTLPCNFMMGWLILPFFPRTTSNLFNFPQTMHPASCPLPSANYLSSLLANGSSPHYSVREQTNRPADATPSPAFLPSTAERLPHLSFRSQPFPPWDLSPFHSSSFLSIQSPPLNKNFLLNLKNAQVSPIKNKKTATKVPPR